MGRDKTSIPLNLVAMVDDYDYDDERQCGIGRVWGFGAEEETLLFECDVWYDDTVQDVAEAFFETLRKALVVGKGLVPDP